MHEIWSVDSKENLYNCCHQMSSFKAKMHQIRFQLRLRPRPCWESLHHSPRLPIAGFSGGLLLGGRRVLPRGPRVSSYATGANEQDLQHTGPWMTLNGHCTLYVVRISRFLSSGTLVLVYWLVYKLYADDLFAYVSVADWDDFQLTTRVIFTLTELLVPTQATKFN